MVLAKVAFDQTHLMRAPLANILGLINLLEMNKTEGEIDPLILPLLLESAKKLDTVINEIVNLI
jgi:signal transduction histidine kinase